MDAIENLFNEAEAGQQQCLAVFEQPQNGGHLLPDLLLPEGFKMASKTTAPNSVTCRVLGASAKLNADGPTSVKCNMQVLNVSGATLRAALGSGAQLVTYSSTKRLAAASPMLPSGYGLPVLLATCASAAAYVTAAAPADLVKTRLMLSRKQQAGGGSDCTDTTGCR